MISFTQLYLTTSMILIWFYEKTFWKHDFYFQQSISEY